MRLSRYFLPVLKENPSEAQIVSHRLMLRAGMIKQSSAGIYSWLPLGFKVLCKLEFCEPWPAHKIILCGDLFRLDLNEDGIALPGLYEPQNRALERGRVELLERGRDQRRADRRHQTED